MFADDVSDEAVESSIRTSIRSVISRQFSSPPPYSPPPSYSNSFTYDIPQPPSVSLHKPDKRSIRFKRTAKIVKWLVSKKS